MSSIAEAMALATVAKMKTAFGRDWVDRSRGKLRKGKSLLHSSKSSKQLTTVVKSEKELEAIAYHLQGDEELETEEACAITPLTSPRPHTVHGSHCALLRPKGHCLF